MPQPVHWGCRLNAARSVCNRGSAANVLETPVVFFVFNRPAFTAQTFATIRAARPARLFIVADAPRADHPTDEANCEETLRIVTEIDWPCDVTVERAERNLGCGQRIVSGLDAVFAREEAAIILEDDCRPDLSFFPFCQQLLACYVDLSHIAMIFGRKSAGSMACGQPELSRCAAWPALGLGDMAACVAAIRFLAVQTPEGSPPKLSKNNCRPPLGTRTTRAG